MSDIKNNRQLHVHISSHDRPGILAEALELIAPSRWNVLDIKQFVFNGLLNLSILLGGDDEVDDDPLAQTLVEFGRLKDMQVTVYPWQSDRRPDAPYSHRSVVTLLGANMDTSVLLNFTATLADLDINIVRIEQLDYGDQHVFEFVIGTREAHSSIDVLNALVKFKESQDVDIAVQDDSMFHRNKRLIVFDADMTFLQCEVIDELGKLAGKGDEMEAMTRQAVAGEVDFTEALKNRVSLLKGLPVAELEKLADRIPITPGAEDLVRILKYLGYKIAIVSGGFQFFIDRLKVKYGLDYGFANQLEITNGQVSGELSGEIINAQTKEDILVSLAEKEGFTLKQVVAVGDGANDIKMLARAGLGIAFNAKPIVQKHARASINRHNLELILYFLGYSGKDLMELRNLISRMGVAKVPSS
jgi:phosphoserine phosphatase